MAGQSHSSWRFAPLDPEKAKGSDKPRLQGIVFDVDGTLCEPQNYMFSEMRYEPTILHSETISIIPLKPTPPTPTQNILLSTSTPPPKAKVKPKHTKPHRKQIQTKSTTKPTSRQALNITKATDILEHIHSLPESQRSEAQEKIRAIERRAMRVQKPQPGLAELMDYLEAKGMRKAICTRNFDEPIRHLLTTFIPTQVFSPIITRSFHPPKPDPAGILHISHEWKIEENDRAKDMIMVGDSIDDMAAGTAAGAVTILLVNPVNEALAQHEWTSHTVKRLDDIIPILEEGSVV